MIGVQGYIGVKILKILRRFENCWKNTKNLLFYTINLKKFIANNSFCVQFFCIYIDGFEIGLELIYFFTYELQKYSNRFLGSMSTGTYTSI